LIQGHGSKKGQTLGEPKALFLNRRQKRAMEGEDMRNNPHGMKNHPIVSHDARLSARKALLAKEMS
jgi:hypothetical protein